MANTTIADLVPNEKVFGQSINLIREKTNTLVNSGLAIRAGEGVNALINSVQNGGPRKTAVPFLNPLSDDYNRSNDDMSDLGDVDKMTASEFTALRHDLNKAVGFADMTRMVTQYSAQGGAAFAIANFWNRIEEKLAVASIKGAIASTTALKSGSSNETTGDDFSLGLIMDALANTGDYILDYKILVVNNSRFGKMRASSDQGFVAPSLTQQFATWNGFTVVISNAFSDTQTLVARSGALAVAEGNPVGMVPTEIDRVPLGGNGGGGEVLIDRKSMIVHPQGFSYDNANVEPTDANLSSAAYWSKPSAVDLDQIGFRMVEHKA